MSRTRSSTSRPRGTFAAAIGGLVLSDVEIRLLFGATLAQKRQASTHNALLMGTTEMVNGVMILAPELKFESVKAEVARMRLDGLLIVEGTNGRGGLHRLTNEKERAEIVASRAAKKEQASGWQRRGSSEKPVWSKRPKRA